MTPLRPADDAGAVSLSDVTAYSEAAGRHYTVTLQQGRTQGEDSQASHIQGKSEDGADAFAAPAGQLKGQDLTVEHPDGRWTDELGRVLNWQARSGSWQGKNDLWSLTGPIRLREGDDGMELVTPEAQWSGLDGVLTLPGAEGQVFTGAGPAQVKAGGVQWHREGGTWKLTDLVVTRGGDRLEAPQATIAPGGQVQLQKGKVQWQTD